MKNSKLKQKHVSLHDFLIKSIISFTPVVKQVKESDLESFSEDSPIDFDKKEIEIQVCVDEIDWIKEGKLNFYSTCSIDVEQVVKGLDIKGETIDGYGSTIVGDELLLNNYDGDFYDQNMNEKGFCDVFGFSTVNKSGEVRFTQIVYSFLFKRLIIRDNVTYKLPFKPDLENDFGGKRAVYRFGSILSLRTNMSVYEKVDKKYWQSDRYKKDLSYPRLQLAY